MSDSESRGDDSTVADSDEEEGRVETRWTCRECPDLVVRTEEEKEKHRQYHRKLRGKGKKGRGRPKSKRPGPASRKKTQLPAPDESLFEEREKTPPATPNRKSTRDKRKKTPPLSPGTRKRIAVQKHQEGVVGKRRFSNG